MISRGAVQGGTLGVQDRWVEGDEKVQQLLTKKNAEYRNKEIF